jgi:hypothetical protein
MRDSVELLAKLFVRVVNRPTDFFLFALSWFLPKIEGV